MKRRTFLITGASSLLALKALPAETAQKPVIDFFNAPLNRENAFCCRNDLDKGLISRKGDLRYGCDPARNSHHFPQTVGFSVAGTDDDPDVVQGAEPPCVPKTPTRFGLLRVKFQPNAVRRHWRLTFGLECGPAPARPTLSASAGTLRLASAERPRSQCVVRVVEFAPEPGSLNAVWART